MKISGKTGSPTPQSDAAKITRAGTDALTKTKGAKEAVSPEKAKAIADSARVDVSERAQQAKKAKEIASAGAMSVNEEKVARLQKLIDEGKYKVAASDIADRLVDEQMNTPS